MSTLYSPVVATFDENPYEIELCPVNYIQHWRQEDGMENASQRCGGRLAAPDVDSSSFSRTLVGNISDVQANQGDPIKTVWTTETASTSITTSSNDDQPHVNSATELDAAWIKVPPHQKCFGDTTIVVPAGGESRRVDREKDLEKHHLKKKKTCIKKQINKIVAQQRDSEFSHTLKGGVVGKRIIRERGPGRVCEKKKFHHRECFFCGGLMVVMVAMFVGIMTWIIRNQSQSENTLNQSQSDNSPTTPPSFDHIPSPEKAASSPLINTYPPSAPVDSLVPTALLTTSTPTEQSSTTAPTEQISTSHPTEQATTAPPSATILNGWQEFVSVLGPLVTVDVAVFDDSSTPQYQAMNWLANVDDMNWPETSLEQLQERYALAALFFGNHGRLEEINFLEPVPVCEWHNEDSRIGVFCDQENHHVETLDLSHQELDGIIPSEMGLLSLLKDLNLDGNKLSGSIPSEIGYCLELSSLQIWGNHLTGRIPTEIGQCRHLQNIDLTWNTDLSGGIPSEIGLCRNLTRLQVGMNHLSGYIPSQIGLMASLTSLDLGGNMLSGPIPVEILSTGLLNDGNFSQLENLELWSNQLTGSIPSEIGYCSNLHILDLFDNKLSGTIPSEIGDCSSLTELRLSSNLLLYSSIPSEIGFCTNLNWFTASHNALDGIIPTELGLCTNLAGIDISDNKLTGALPSELGRLTHLYAVDLSQNKFDGDIPKELGALAPTLEKLYLDHNPSLKGDVEELCQTTEFSNPRFVMDCAVGDDDDSSAPDVIGCCCCERCCSKGDDDDVSCYKEPTC